jgi:hypothetical protein
LNPGNYSRNGNSYTINCPASGTARYDWNPADSSGAQAQQTLINQLLGRPLSAAQSQCNGSYPGISPGSCVITLTGGNASILPSDPKAIVIVAN